MTHLLIGLQQMMEPLQERFMEVAQLLTMIGNITRKKWKDQSRKHFFQQELKKSEFCGPKTGIFSYGMKFICEFVYYLFVFSVLLMFFVSIFSI